MYRMAYPYYDTFMDFVCMEKIAVFITTIYFENSRNCKLFHEY